MFSEILFVCVHNAGRSQVAKALFNRLARDRGLPFRAESAGTEPAGSIHPNVVLVMKEYGIDISHERPKLLTNDMAARARKVITMGCQVDAASCPAVFIRGIEDWGLPDPRGKNIDEVRAIRGEIERRVAALLDSLQAD